MDSGLAPVGARRDDGGGGTAASMALMMHLRRLGISPLIITPSPVFQYLIAP
jgi:hypothetical protein